MKKTMAAGTRNTPVGPVRFAVDDSGNVVALGFDAHWEGLACRLHRRFGDVAFAPSRAAALVGDALDAYLAGDIFALDALPVSLGGTDFQRRVWTALRGIAPGTTCSYASIARAIGAPRAVRAVGAANGANPVSIIVPCHRVIGSDGSLTGYGGGVDRKVWLLAHEAEAPRFRRTVDTRGPAVVFQPASRA